MRPARLAVVVLVSLWLPSRPPLRCCCLFGCSSLNRRAVDGGRLRERGSVLRCAGRCRRVSGCRRTTRGGSAQSSTDDSDNAHAATQERQSERHSSLAFSAPVASPLHSPPRHAVPSNAVQSHRRAQRYKSRHLLWRSTTAGEAREGAEQPEAMSRAESILCWPAASLPDERTVATRRRKKDEHVATTPA